MRTTVDIEDDLLRRLRAEATRRRVSFKHLLNRVLRRGLEPAARGASGRYRCPARSLGTPRPGVDLDRALALADALADDAARRKLELRK
jgi:hypothetical protein